MSHILGEMFGWPSGNVLGNLMASAMWTTPALAHLHWRQRRHHRALLAEIRKLAAQVDIREPDSSGPM